MNMKSVLMLLAMLMLGAVCGCDSRDPVGDGIVADLAKWLLDSGAPTDPDQYPQWDNLERMKEFLKVQAESVKRHYGKDPDQLTEAERKSLIEKRSAAIKRYKGPYRLVLAYMLLPSDQYDAMKR